MLDLALDFLIGAAFATVVESLTNPVLMQLVATIFGTPDPRSTGPSLDPALGGTRA